MKKKIAMIALILWLLIFLTDIICAFTISRPIFMLEAMGGERTDYYGLGYSITHWYSWSGDEGFSINPIPYIVINCGIIGYLLIKKKRK